MKTKKDREMKRKQGSNVEGEDWWAFRNAPKVLLRLQYRWIRVIMIP